VQKIVFSWGFALDPLGELTALPQIPYVVGRGLATPLQEPHPASALQASALAVSSPKHPRK